MLVGRKYQQSTSKYINYVWLCQTSVDVIIHSLISKPKILKTLMIVHWTLSNMVEEILSHLKTAIRGRHNTFTIKTISVQ